MQLNIFKSNEQVKELEAEKVSLLNRFELAEKDLRDAQDVIAGFMVKQKKFDSTIEELKKEHASTIESLKKENQTKMDVLAVQLEEAKVSAGKQAAQVLASMGVEPETVKVEVVPTTGDILAKFESLTGKAKSDFYAAYRDQILKATGMVK